MFLLYMLAKNLLITEGSNSQPPFAFDLILRVQDLKDIFLWFWPWFSECDFELYFQEPQKRPKFPQIIEVLRRLMATEAGHGRQGTEGRSSSLGTEHQGSGFLSYGQSTTQNGSSLNGTSMTPSHNGTSLGPSQVGTNPVVIDMSSVTNSKVQSKRADLSQVAPKKDWLENCTIFLGVRVWLRTHVRCSKTVYRIALYWVRIMWKLRLVSFSLLLESFFWVYSAIKLRILAICWWSSQHQVGYLKSLI